MAGEFIDKKKRLPSPLPKPSAHSFVYDATSRRIELEQEHVRLRRRQGKNFPLFFKPMKKYTHLTISKQIKRPRHLI